MAAPKLQLDVTLNLAAFRKDLGKVAQAAAAYYYPVNLLINKKNFEAQLKVLSKIKPVINIEDSQLIGARARIATLNKSLATLRRATATPIEIKVKYTEVGKPPSGATAQIGKAVSGGIKADQALQGLSYKQAQAARQMMVAASIPVGALGKNRSMEAYMKSLTEGMKNAGEESIAGLAQGLKDGKSAIGQAAKNVGESGLRALKDFWGIASPSRVFKQIGEFAVDGLELGFLNGLKDFQSKSISEVRKITAALKFELAKIGAFVAGEPAPLPRATGPQTPWRQSWSQFLQQRQQPSPPQGSRAYTSPIGPLPLNSQDPWASAGAGYTPRLASSIYQRSPQFPMSGMMGPSSPVPPSPPRNNFLAFSQRATQIQQGGVVPSGGFPTSGPIATRATDVLRIRAAMDVASASLRNFTANQIPVIGGIKNLADEFGQAAKQVLLYGTAYKGLAFVTSLPGQILNAAKSQQQFNNSLQTATQDTGTFAKELLYVDNVQRAFGLNLETTRTGFTRLYASMAPTGFDSGSIEKLFTGISAATAALQLTPDKAERVIYAFGQMASKGQIMSEELKGQLGDVLPGALAIFSKAAGMSVKDFSKAMEDGEFKGKRFREVFAKVSDELMNRFGTGAQAAGKSLQGLLNTVGSDFQRTLESFAPLANAAAQALLIPLGGALRQLSTSAQIAMGELERLQGQIGSAKQDAADLRAGGAKPEQIRAAEQNVAALEARYNSLNEALKDPAVAKQVKDLQLLVQELTKAGTFVLNLASAIGSALSPVVNFLGTNLTSVIATITAFYVGFQTARLAAMALMAVLLLYRGLSTLLGFSSAAQQALALSGAFNVLGVSASRAKIQLVGVRLALTALVAATVVGAVVAGIVAIAGAFATMSDKAKEAAQSSNDAAKAAIDAARAGNVAGAAMGVQGVLTESRKATGARQALEGIYARATPEQRKGITPMSITAEESVALQGTSLTAGIIKAGVSRGGARQIRVPSTQEMGTIRGQFGSLAGQQAINLREAKAAAVQAEEVNKRLGLNKPTPGATPAETSTGDAKASAKAAKAAEELQEEIARQAAAASDALFTEQQRLLVLQQTNPIAEAFTKYTSQELTIQRELNAKLKEAKSEKEKIDLKEAARLQNASNLLELQENINEAGKQALQPLEDLLKNQREELFLNGEVEKLMREGISPERAKQIADVRLLVKQQLEALDLSINQARAAVVEAEARGASAQAVKDLRKELQGLEEDRKKAEGKGEEAEEGVPKDKPKDYLGEGLKAAQDRLKELMNIGYQVVGAANAIGDAFGEAFKGIASGTMTAQQALASFFQSVGDYFIDMAARMVAEWLKIQLIQGLANFIGGIFGGGGFGGAVSGATKGITGQTGDFFTGDFEVMPAANGAVWKGGFQGFANGGMVTGPTMGLVGEGRYNEAIVPLPNGKSIPVELGGAAGNQINSNITVNVNNGQAQSNATGSNSSELGRKIEGAVKQVIVGELRPGGLLASR